MDIFTVTDKSGKVIKSGFETKEEAKKVREELLVKSGLSLEEIKEIKEKRTYDLPYMVGRGKDHYGNTLQLLRA